MRHSLKSRYTARERPQTLQRDTARVENFGGRLSFTH
jgi:hypothetical protein